MGKRGPEGTSTNKRAVTKRSKNALNNLNLKQQAFCKLYTKIGSPFYGNGVQSYMVAFGVKIGTLKGQASYDSCKVRASVLLTDVNILSACNELLELGNFNNVFVDSQLEFLVTQNSNFNVKLGSIKEYNSLKGRIIRKIGGDGPTFLFMGDIIRESDKKQPPVHKDVVVVEEKVIESQVEGAHKKLTGGDTIDRILEKNGI